MWPLSGLFPISLGAPMPPDAQVEREAVWGFPVLRSVKTGPFRLRWKVRTVKTRLPFAFGNGQAYGVGGPESIIKILANCPTSECLYS